MKYRTFLALGLAAIGLATTAPAASAMPIAPEKAIAIVSEDAGVRAAHWTGYYHGHGGYYRPYRPYYRPYYRPRPYYGGYGWRGRGWHGGWGHPHYRRW